MQVHPNQRNGARTVNHSKSLLLASLAALLVCGPALSQMTFAAKPGRSLGDIELGQSRKSVKEQLGPAHKTFSTHGKRTAEVWRDTADGTEMEVVYQQDRVVQVKASAKEFRDPTGIGPGASLTRIQRAYPGIRRTNYLFDNESGKGLDYYDDVRRGIAFVFPGPDAKPARRRKAWSVIIHHPRSKAIPTEVKSLSNTGTINRR